MMKLEIEKQNFIFRFQEKSQNFRTNPSDNLLTLTSTIDATSNT